MVGIGRGRATIMMSSTPFWLANTGGSWKLAANDAPAASVKAAAAPAAGSDRKAARRHARWIADIDVPPFLAVLTRSAKKGGESGGPCDAKQQPSPSSPRSQ